jgi:hypothetical protein
MEKRAAMDIERRGFGSTPNLLSRAFTSKQISSVMVV